MATLNRQQLRQAERRLSKKRFPFPEFASALDTYLRSHRGTILQIRGRERIFSNLSGKTKEYTLSEFYDLLATVF